MQKVLHGPVGEEWRHHPLKDINFIEVLGVAPLMGAMLVLGIYPRWRSTSSTFGVQGLLSVRQAWCMTFPS